MLPIWLMMQMVMCAVYVAAGLIAATLVLFSIRRRRESPTRATVALMLTGASTWSVAQALAVSADTRGSALWWSYAVFPGVAVVVAGYFWHCLVFAGRRVHRPRRLLSLLLIHPVLLLAAVGTDPWHHAFYRRFDFTAGRAPVIHPGWLYWVHTLYSYALVAAGTILTVRAMRRTVRGQRRGHRLFLAGGLAPVAGNVVTLFLNVNAQRYDLTPVLFIISGIVWLMAERAGVNSEGIPIGHGQVIAALSDAVMVLDPNGRFLDINPAAAVLLAALHPAGSGALIGRHWQEIAGPHLTDFLSGADQSTVTGRDGTVYDVRAVRMQASDGTCPGTVVVVRDVTELERLRAELTDMAIRDGLTGVYNRRHLEAVLADAGTTPELSVVLIDVDHFKGVNDRYGHAVGDQVLVRVAQQLAAGVRQTDTVARYGGEEFVVVMPGIDATMAAERADQWRRRCAAVAVDTPLGPLTVTFSAGVSCHAAGDTPGELLRRADEALYRAKDAGRDRVMVAVGG